jgi:hypothetical protein
MPTLLRLVRGEYIAWCDGDDYWTDHQKLEKQLTSLEENTDCVGVFHWVKKREEARGRISDRWPPPSFKSAKYTLDDFLAGPNFVPSCSPLTRRECSAEFQCFDLGPAFGDFCFHMMNLMHGPYVFIDEPMAVYRQHDKGMFSSLSSLEQVKRLLEGQKYLGTKLGLNKRTSFNKGIVLTYRRLRTIYANQGNVKESLRATLKTLPYVSWRMYKSMIICEYKFLISWYMNKLPSSIKNQIKQLAQKI